MYEPLVYALVGGFMLVGVSILSAAKIMIIKETEDVPASLVGALIFLFSLSIVLMALAVGMADNF